MINWHRRFLDAARFFGSWSKDPNTKVGAVAFNDAKQIVETGYNGPPRGVRDLPERMSREGGAKYIWTAHAEENLVAHAARSRLEGTTVAVSHYCCNACARMLINAGVKRILAGPGVTNMPPELREAAEIMFAEAGVEVIHVDCD